MYAEIDRVDIVTTGPDGKKRWIQTDHRTAAEAREDRALSTVLCAVRVLSALTQAGAAGAVEYAADHEPPRFLRAVVAGLGAELTVKGAAVAWDGDAIDPQVAVAEAMTHLARQVAHKYGLRYDDAGVRTYERKKAKEIAPASSERSAEGTRVFDARGWSAVVRLAALGGEAVIRNVRGAAWEPSAVPDQLPFVLVAPLPAGRCELNFLGKAMRYFEHGEPDSVAALVGWALSR